MMAKTEATAAVNNANLSLQNSGVSFRYRMVFLAEISYTESGSSSTDLSRLRSVGDGYLDEVHGLRDYYKADVVSLLTELAVMLLLRTHGPALRSVPGSLLMWTTVAVAAFAVAVPFIGPFARVFSFVALPWPVLGAMLAIVVGYILATELAKRWFFRGRGP